MSDPASCGRSPSALQRGSRCCRRCRPWPSSCPATTPAAGTASPDIVESLNRAVNADLADGAFKAKLADLGGMPAPMTPKEFGKFIAEETEKWAKVNTFANIKAE